MLSLFTRSLSKTIPQVAGKSAFLNSPIRNISHSTVRKVRLFEFDSFNAYNNYQQESGDRFQILDFYADWSGPAKMQSSRLESKVAGYDEDDFDLIRVDIDHAVDLAQYFQVEQVPTLISIVQGEQIDRVDGAVDDETLDEIIDHLLEQSQHHG